VNELPQQPTREPEDGAVSVRRETIDGRERILLSCGEHQEGLELSPYNAWRIFGMLSIILELPLSKQVGKAIKLGSKDDFQASVVTDVGAATVSTKVGGSGKPVTDVFEKPFHLRVERPKKDNPRNLTVLTLLFQVPDAPWGVPEIQLASKPLTGLKLEFLPRKWLRSKHGWAKHLITDKLLLEAAAFLERMGMSVKQTTLPKTKPARLP